MLSTLKKVLFFCLSSASFETSDSKIPTFSLYLNNILRENRMNFFNPLFIIPIITGPLVLVVFLITRQFPPKKINSLYGYRTRRSMANTEAWQFAQVYSTKLMIKSMIFYSSTALIGLFFGNENDGLLVLLALIIMIAFFAIPIIKIEKELKNRFG